MENDSLDLIPQKGSRIIYVPTNIDGTFIDKEENKRQRDIIAIFITLIEIIALIVFAIAYDSGIAKKLGILLAMILCYTLVMRFLVFKEYRFRKPLKELEKNDYNYDSKAFWRIYKIEDKYPYICYFKNGEIGVFVRFEKDVSVGNREEKRYEHFECVADAYNKLGNLNTKAYYIDLMDAVGKDNRLNTLYSLANNSKSQGLKTVYTSIFENLKINMETEYTSYDIYLFKEKVNSKTLYNNVMDIVAYMIGGNYSSYTILDNLQIRDVAESLLNLENFSVISACKNAVEAEGVTSITPIYSVLNNGEKIVFNKTVSELKAERKIQENEKRTKRRRVKKVEDFEINLDEEDK